MFGLVRTSRMPRKPQGITFVLIDMTSAGIQIRPLVMTSGERIQNQVFFDEVRVPKSNVLGEIDDGWTVAKYLLEFERGGGASAPALQVMAEEIATVATNQPGPGGRPLLDDPAFARKLADAHPHRGARDSRIPGACRRGRGQESRRGVIDAQSPDYRTEPGAHRTCDGRGRTARAGLPTARHSPRRPGVRIRAASGRIRQRRPVAGGRSTAVLQRSSRLNLRRQQRNSAEHPRQGSIGALMDFNLTKEQELLRDGLARFLSTRYGLEKSRAAAKTGAGWQPGIWRGFADELGILGAALSRRCGRDRRRPGRSRGDRRSTRSRSGGRALRRHGRGGGRSLTSRRRRGRRLGASEDRRGYCDRCTGRGRADVR